MRKILLTGSILLLLPAVSYAQMEWLKKQVDSLKGIATQSVTTAKLSDTQIGAGLKEALKVGLENAIKSTGKTGGFFDNPAIKIMLPEKVRAIEPVLKKIGLNKQVDEFVLSMNSAAESATPLATDVFAAALTDMSIDDAKKILAGGNNAATTYFMDKTKDKLIAAFQPIVRKTLDKYEISQKYNQLTSSYKKIPFAKSLPSVDANQYVTTKTIDGLFTVLGEEEAKIRTDPAARVTSLLKKVFK
ncbi:MAG: DUF4197 domain-containing protein [Candidatus Omnitrophica bacterium]|nr:DUF4197 domain-containing protein [Candidatus Omnitrophota bacterium]